MSEATTIKNDGELAAAIAKAAGRLLLGLRESGLFEGKALGASGDAIAQKMIAEALALHRPNDAVLSEEAADDLSRLKSGRASIWCCAATRRPRSRPEPRRRGCWSVALGPRPRRCRWPS
jgi:3'(2'), 5'-bisphosphate nucleotidase